MCGIFIFYIPMRREDIQKRGFIKRKLSLKVGWGSIWKPNLFLLKIRKFLPGGRGSESKCPYFLLNFKWFLERFFKGNHPLIFPKMFATSKPLYFGHFWVNFSTLSRNALDFQWYPLWLWFKIAKFGFWSSPNKCSDLLILGSWDGVKKAKKNYLFFS